MDDLPGRAGLERLAQDLRHAARALRRDWRLTAIAVLVLALGIGGNTLVFGLANALLLNPFPYPHADRLVEIESRHEGGAWLPTVPVGDFGEWREAAASFDGMAAYGCWRRSSLTGQSLPGFEGPVTITTGHATDAFLRVLGVAPALGRFFTPDEDRPGGPPVVVLGYGTWRRRFGGARDVLGQTLTLDGRVHTIVGVMPAGLALPGSFTCDAWMPAAFDFAIERQEGYNTRFDGDRVVARLKPDVARARAQTEMAVIGRRLAREYPWRSAGWEERVVPLGHELAVDEGARLRTLGLIVATGLLLVCVNLAGLLLARGGARSREVAVRAALGAGRARLVREALAESLLLALCGGGLGLALAGWGVGAVGRAAPAYLGLDSALRVDPTVIAFAVGVSVLTGVVFGLLPALRGSRVGLTTLLRGAPGDGRATPRGRLLSTIVVAEVALALLLLVGGGLMVRSFIGLTRIDTGLRPDGLLTFQVGLSGPRYQPDARRAAFFGALLDRLRSTPGVTSAAAVWPLPMSRVYSGGPFTIEGRAVPADPRTWTAQYCRASPGYFRTMGIPVVAGRTFDESDGAGPPVVVVNQTFARRFFPAENPVGRRLTGRGTIVGVIGDVRHNGPAAEPDPQLYLPIERRMRVMSIVVRTAGDPLAVLPAVREQVHALDTDLPLDRLKPMTTVVGESIANERVLAGLVGGFALFALALAAIGLYGVIAYAVSRRRQEIGVRLALGATRGDVLRMVLGHGARLAALGIAVGVPAALLTVRLIASFLYRLSPYDPVVLTAVPVLLLAVAVAASYVPARHATKVDPLASLRAE